MKLIFTIIISVLFFSKAESQTVAQHYQTKDFDLAVFPKEYKIYGFEKRFTPTKEEILLAEKALQTQLEEINKNLPNQSSSPVIHKNLKKYKRQYFGVYDENGERILFINAFWGGGSEYWLDEIIIVHDGGSYYWQVEFNISENKLYNLMVNGYA
ncbi:MAG: hypothetical protein WCY25_07810 [Moheibacter sp.]